MSTENPNDWDCTAPPGCECDQCRPDLWVGAFAQTRLARQTSQLFEPGHDPYNSAEWFAARFAAKYAAVGFRFDSDTIIEDYPVPEPFTPCYPGEEP